MSGLVGQCRVSVLELKNFLTIKQMKMNTNTLNFSRRDALQAMSGGFGFMAFAGLSTMAAESYRNPLSPKQPHFKPRAKPVSYTHLTLPTKA